MKNYFSLSDEKKMNLRDALRRGIWGTDGFVWNNETQIWDPEGEPTPEKVRHLSNGLLDYYYYYSDMLRYVTESIQKWGYAVITDDRCPHWFLYELGYRMYDEYEDLDNDDNNYCHYLVFSNEDDLDSFINGDELPEEYKCRYIVSKYGHLAPYGELDEEQAGADDFESAMAIAHEFESEVILYDDEDYIIISIEDSETIDPEHPWLGVYNVEITNKGRKEF